MRIITVNVNGVRAAARRGAVPWLVSATPDILTMQEVRAGDEQLAEVLAEAGLGEWHVRHTESSTKGRAGVAVASCYPMSRSAVGVAGIFADQGRWVEAVVETPRGPLTVVSAYVHTGEAETDRQVEKYAFLDAMTARMERAVAAGEEMVVTGDLNVAHREEDLKNWKGNLGKAGFLVGERAYLDRWLASGWHDGLRDLAGPGPGPYTWWSWRGKAFDNDAGWRIDYQLATPGLAARASSVTVGRAPTYAERWSDHAPVVVDYRD